MDSVQSQEVEIPIDLAAWFWHQTGTTCFRKGHWQLLQTHSCVHHSLCPYTSMCSAPCWSSLQASACPRLTSLPWLTTWAGLALENTEPGGPFLWHLEVLEASLPWSSLPWAPFRVCLLPRHSAQAPGSWWMGGTAQLSAAGLSFLTKTGSYHISVVSIICLGMQKDWWFQNTLVRYGHFPSSLWICDILYCKWTGQKNELPCAVSPRNPKPGPSASHLYTKPEEDTEHPQCNRV